MRNKRGAERTKVPVQTGGTQMAPCVLFSKMAASIGPQGS